MTLSITRTKSISATLTNDSSICITTDQITSGSNSLPNLTRTIGDGTGAGQANKWYRAYRTLAAGATDNLDLSGSLTDPFGNTLSFTGVKYIAIAIVSPDGTKKLVVGNGTNPFNGPLSSAGTIDILDEQEFYNPSASGWTVTAGTGDILKINNPGGSAVNYCILIAGNG